MAVVFVLDPFSVEFGNKGCTVKILDKVDGSQPFSDRYDVETLEGLKNRSWITITDVVAVKSVFDIK